MSSGEYLLRLVELAGGTEEAKKLAFLIAQSVNDGRSFAGETIREQRWDSWQRIVELKERIAELEETNKLQSTARRELDRVDETMPEWKGTGRGRIETLEMLMNEAFNLRMLINKLAREEYFTLPEAGLYL